MVNTTKPLQDQEIQSRDRILPNTGILVFFRDGIVWNKEFSRFRETQMPRGPCASASRPMPGCKRLLRRSVGTCMKKMQLSMAARLGSCLGHLVTERVLGTPSSLPATHQCHLSIFTGHTVTHRDGTCLSLHRLMLNADGPKEELSAHWLLGIVLKSSIVDVQHSM